MVKFNKLVRTSLLAAVAVAAIEGSASAQLRETLQTAAQSTRDGVTTQERINNLDDQRTDIELEYRTLLQSIEGQRLFIEQQQVFLRSQENEIESIQQQLERVDTIERDISPMMREMVQSLEEFINLDLPFNLQGPEGRLARIERLYELLDDPDISPAERYRVILNAYDAESAAGRSVRAYDEDILDESGAAVTVKVLQIGRVALVRRYPNGDMTIMTADSQDWQPLPGSYLSDVTRAIRIAEEVTTPDIFRAPLPGPTQAQ